MSNEISISLEETNKLRASIGLKPIVVETSNKTSEIVRPLPKAKKSQPDTVAKENNVSQNPPNYTNADIGIEESNLDDTDDWLLGLMSSKSQKPQEAEKKAEPPAEYSSKDLKGIKIGHAAEELSDLKDGVVLTLKDTELLNPDDADGDDNVDELEAENLVAKKRVQDNLKAKLGRNKSRFKGYEDETSEDLDSADLNKGSIILNGGEIDVSKVKAEKEKLQEPGERKNKRKIVLSEDEDDLESLRSVAQDYQELKPIKMKKLKKKMKSNDGKKSKLDDSLDVEKELKYVELSIDGQDGDDDEELTSLLALLRKQKLNLRKRSSPEQYVKQELGAGEFVNPDMEGGMVIDEATEFLNAIKKEEPTIEEKIPTPEPKVAVKQETSPKQVPALPEVKEESTEGNEESVGTGLGSTLKLLQQRSILSKLEGSLKEIKQEQRELLKQRELLELEKLQLSKDDVRGLQRIIQKEQDLLRNYNPVVNIKYHDENGKTLTTKEAYKQLSHQFHGKAPSNNKIDKMNKKRALNNL